MINSRILGTGSFLPETIRTNADIEKMVDTTDEWIRSRTGIEQRHIVSADQTTSTLAVEAGRRAIEAAGLKPEDIDFVVVGSVTPDLVFPNLGTMVQHQLGIPACAAMGLEAACSGFIYALSVADKYVRLQECKYALVIGAETLSRIVDWEDRNTCVLFGDGAGAVVIGPSEEEGILSTHLGADGQFCDLLYGSSGPSKFTSLEDRSNPVIKMAGNEVFKVAVRTLGAAVDTALNANNMDKDAIDWLVPHQANTRIIQATAKRLGMSMDRVVLTVNKHGNTSSASVPLALDTAVRDGRIKRGDLLLLEAFGGGFTWGSALVRF